MDDRADKKRTFFLLRAVILKSLSTGVKTINQIAKEQSINWKTVELHLTFLVGKGYVKEIFNSQYVRLFELTSLGKEHLKGIESNFSVYRGNSMEGEGIGLKLEKET